MPETKDKQNFEAQVETIEHCLEALESGELSLEQSLHIYEKGMKSLKQCHQLLELARGKVQLLMEQETSEDDEPSFAEYDPESGGTKLETSNPKKRPKKKATKDESAPEEDQDTPSKDQGKTLF